MELLEAIGLLCLVALVVAVIMAVRRRGTLAQKIGLVLSRVAAVCVGVFLLLVLFVLSFADGTPTLYLFLGAFVVSFGSGLAFGFLGPKTSLRWAPWILAPSLLVLLVLTVMNTVPTFSAWRVLGPIGFALSMVAENLAGLWTGSFVRRRIEAQPVDSGPPALADDVPVAEAAD